MTLRPVLVASHPRSGTHFMIDFIRKNIPSTASWRFWGLPLNRLYLNIETLTSRHRPVGHKLARRIVERPQRPLMKTHFLPDFSESWIEEQSGPLDPQWREMVDRAHTIYITRDPWAVMTSTSISFHSRHRNMPRCPSSSSANRRTGRERWIGWNGGRCMSPPGSRSRTYCISVSRSSSPTLKAAHDASVRFSARTPVCPMIPSRSASTPYGGCACRA